MNIVSFFTDVGTPKTGLSPIIDIWKLDGTQVVTAQPMSEIDGGFYTYDFSTYDEDEDYVIRADGTNTLRGADRYAYSTNETAGVSKILQIEKGNWSIVGTQMIFYDADGTTELIKFDLKNKTGTATDTDVFSRAGV